MVYDIYGETDLKKSAEKQNFIHYFFKYKILVPLLTLAWKLFWKRIKFDVKYNNHTKIYFVARKSLERAKKVWSEDWFSCTYNNTKKDSRKCLKKQFKLIDIMWNILFTMCYKDTAYDALFKILSFEFVKEMQNRYPGNVLVPLYCSRRTDDITYAMVNEGKININGKTYIIELKEIKEGETNEDRKTTKH